MERKGIKTLLIQLTASVLLALLGLGLGIYTFRESSYQLIAESQQHLQDIAKSVDQNIDNVFDQVVSELDFSVKNYKADFSRSPLAQNPLVSDIVAFGHGFPLISCLDEGRSYSIKSLHENIGLCIDEAGNSYLLFVNDTHGHGYGALVDLSSFYQRIVVASITYHYWVVLYEQESSLMLQNEYQEPEYLLLSPWDIENRQDGYSIIQRRERLGASGTERYSYVNDDDGKQEFCHMSVLTSNENQNGIFAIGVAADTVAITSVMQRIMLWLSACAGLILLALVLLMYSVMNHRRKGIAVEKQLKMTKELLEKQTELQRNQRLEALGVMTSSIAHDFNNLLTPITGYSLLCMEKVPEDSEVYDNLLAIYQAADKARITVRRLSALTRKTKESMCSEVCPDEIVARVLELSAPTKPKTVDIETDLNCRELTFCVDETQILQVLLNLLLNAYQAMEGLEGKVRIRTEVRDGNVLFTVSDSGPGIPKEIFSRIFDPFFTTKETGKGSGLGLAIARQVAETHHGSITASSVPGQGASFTLSIPMDGCNS